MTVTIRANVKPARFSGVYPIKLTSENVVAIVTGLSAAEAGDLMTECDQFGAWASSIEPTALDRLIGDFDKDVQAQIRALVAFCVKEGQKITVLSNNDRRGDWLKPEEMVPPEMTINPFDSTEIDWCTEHALNVFDALGLPFSASDGLEIAAKALVRHLSAFKDLMAANDFAQLSALADYAIKKGGPDANVLVF